MKAKEIFNASVYKIDDDKIDDRSVFVIHYDGEVYICEVMDY